METCPICGNEHAPNTACQLCGYDLTLEYESHPTFFLIGNQKSLDERRQLWKRAREGERKAGGLYHCPVCSNTGFFLILEREVFLCQQCRSAFPANMVFSYLLESSNQNRKAVQSQEASETDGADGRYGKVDYLNQMQTDRIPETLTLLLGLKADILWGDNGRISNVMELLSPKRQVEFAHEQVIMQIDCNNNGTGKLAVFQASQTGDRCLKLLSHSFSLTVTDAGIYLISDFGSFWGSKSLESCSLNSIEVKPLIDTDTKTESCHIQLMTAEGVNYSCILNIKANCDAQKISNQFNSFLDSLRQGKILRTKNE